MPRAPTVLTPRRGARRPPAAGGRRRQHGTRVELRSFREVRGDSLVKKCPLRRLDAVDHDVADDAVSEREGPRDRRLDEQPDFRGREEPSGHVSDIGAGYERDL